MGTAQVIFEVVVRGGGATGNDRVHMRNVSDVTGIYPVRKS